MGSDLAAPSLVLVLSGAGGVRQYLHMEFPMRAKRAEQIAEILQKKIPDLDSAPYHLEYPVPVCLQGHPCQTQDLSVSEQSCRLQKLTIAKMPGKQDDQPPFLLRLAAFSVENEASIREPPGLDTSLKLISHFAVDGFVTVAEPILIRLQAPSSPVMPKTC